MKKSISTFIKSVILSAAAAVFMASCFDPIFYDIEQDVPPETATVNGNIISIARYEVAGTEYLFTTAQDGLIYKKASDSTHDAWVTFPKSKLPFVLHFYDYYGDGKGDSSKNPEGIIGHIGQQIIKVLANSDTLYLVTVEYTNDDAEGASVPKQFHIWASKMTEKNGTINTDAAWTDVLRNVNADNQVLTFYKSSSDYLYYTSFNVFSTNAPKTAHRRVFFRSGNSESANIYELTDASVISDINAIKVPSVTIFDAAEGNENNTGDIDGAVYLGDTMYFMQSNAYTSNETATTDANYVYFVRDDSKILYYSDTPGSAQYAFDEDKDGDNSYELPSNVSCLAATDNSIIIGLGELSLNSAILRGGIARTSLNNGIPGKATISFDSNAAVQFSSGYVMLTLLVVDPSKAENSTDIYATITYKGTGASSSVTNESVGLWSYYPARDNWNRE